MPFHVQLNKRRVKLKNGSVVVYWTLRWPGTTGKWHSESVGKVGEMTKAQAETLRREKEGSMNMGLVRRDRPRDITLKEYLDLDYERIKPDLKLNTIEGHKHAGAHAMQALGESIRMSAIGRVQIARIKTYLADEKKVSAATIAKTLRMLKASFYRAVKDGLLHENPFAGVKLPRTQSRAKRIFSPDETAAMRAAADSLWWEVCIGLAESSGLRKGELLNLQWRDVDFEAKTVRVAAKRAGVAKVKGAGEVPVLAWSAKSYEERTVPLPDATVSLLARLQGASDGSPYVFLSVERLKSIAVELEVKDGKLGPNYELVNNFHRRFDEIQLAARALLAKARKVEPDALAWDRGTFHDFRRTYGTRLARVVPIHVLKEYMGHAKIQTTQEYYLAAETQDGERAREALNTMLVTATAFPPDARISRAMDPKPEHRSKSKNDKPLPKQGLSSEADGTRTRNHRIDSPVL